LNDVTQILSRLTPVATATKFETKTAITRVVYEISPRSFRLQGVFWVKLSNHVREILKRQTLVAMATKFGTKRVIT